MNLIVNLLEVFPLLTIFKTLGWLIVFFAIGVGLGSVGLRFAAKILRIEGISFQVSLGCMLLSNFTIMVFSMVVGLNYGFSVGLTAASNGGRTMMNISPSSLYFFWQLIFGLVLTTVALQHVYSRASVASAPPVNPKTGEVPVSSTTPPKLNFRESFLVTALGLAITASIFLVLAVILLGFISLFV